MDAIINAIHREAVSNVLPYVSDYDNLSWWYSQLIVIYKAYYLYHGHILQHSRLVVLNPEHSPYPREQEYNST